MTLPHIKENNVIALVQAVKQMENERDRIKRIPVSFWSYYMNSQLLPVVFKVSIAASQIRNFCLENQRNDPLLNNHRDGNPFDDDKRRCVILWIKTEKIENYFTLCFRIKIPKFFLTKKTRSQKGLIEVDDRCEWYISDVAVFVINIFYVKM